MRKITIKDVARNAGVSIAAVSYVLNGKENKVSQDTIVRIHESIKELNYIPSITARGLVKNTSELIGVIIPQTEDHKQLVFENPFYSEMISAIEAVVREDGYHIILAGVDKGKTYLDISTSRNLDGAIIMGIYSEQLYEECKQANIPIVLIDSYVHDNEFTNVGIDDELGGYMATKHLIDNGHRNIGLVTGMIRKDGVVEKRFLGYKRALQEAGLFYNPDYVFENSVSYVHGRSSGALIAEKYPEITGVFATADMVAFGLIRGIKEAGKEVPEDISVIGFDDISMAHMFLPPLTTVKQQIFLKGETAAKLLIDQIRKKRGAKAHGKRTHIPLEIVERETVRNLRGD
ncbi:LacI family transcriptional regulator [Cohnella sp. CIP 111063]|uniref:LacI family DNA-binding transcriptional regulator n=1 Tax=unclassified Cohnella TaxID=2636738 RepID=UPI000B8C60CE|nr:MULTISPECIES: LacI family DNA-binding transcriptional regulator [unclassified Cohnella]OXS61698.1 LacI family transcriptional regulator [Cohnella sp. CIP 111063]PRX74123.1 LacI family transcriptional regulator [Cohnella sp. SGD-V74]